MTAVEKVARQRSSVLELAEALGNVSEACRQRGMTRSQFYTVPDEFFRVAFRTRFYESVDALQTDLDAWITHDHPQRPLQGYRNMGHRPIVTINQYMETVKGEA